MRSRGDLRVSVRTHCHLLRAGTKLPRPNKPHIVKLLLEDLGGGDDAGVMVADEPLILEEADVELAAQLILGSRGNTLPVVYLSANRRGFPEVDAKRVSQWLGGMAHVVVEPSTYFSFALARRIPGLNPYNGAIGVCWPRGEGSQVRLLALRYDSTDELAADVTEHVRNALTYVQHNRDCSWNAINQMVSQKRISELRNAGSDSLEDWMAAFEGESKAKEEQIAEMRMEAERLKSEIRRLQSAAALGGSSVLSAGKEKPLYPGELQDAVAYALRASRSHLTPDGRVSHVVDDLIDANASTGTPEEISEGVKAALGSGGKLGATQKGQLRDLGFALDEGGGHIKATFGDDERYMFVLPKTPSDHRSGKNSASDILKKLFK